MLENAAKKEIERMQTVIKAVNAEVEGRHLLKLAESYLTDAKYFFEKGKFLEAFEAAVIAWAYIDAGLHMKVLKVDEKFKRIFTV